MKYLLLLLLLYLTSCEVETVNDGNDCTSDNKQHTWSKWERMPEARAKSYIGSNYLERSCSTCEFIVFTKPEYGVRKAVSN